MESWRKIVMDAIRGVDTTSDESVGEAINRCRCEPPARSSGSFGEAVRRLAEEKGESLCRTTFERLVFGFRQGKGRGSEENTPHEDDIWDSVTDWIGGGVHAGNLSSGLVRDFEFIKKCMKEYPDEFVPTVDVLWRGISVTGETALGILPSMKKYEKSEDRLQIGSGLFLGVRGVYRDRRALQSWAAEPSVAAKFALGNSLGSSRNRSFRYFTSTMNQVDSQAKRWAKEMKAGVSRRDIVQDIGDQMREAQDDILKEHTGVVYTIKTDKNCVFSEWFANKISRTQYLGNESEVVRIAEPGSEVKATVYAEEGFVEAIARYNRTVDELEKVLGKDFPKRIKRIANLEEK